MSRIQASVRKAVGVLMRSYARGTAAEEVTDLLTDTIHYCNATRGVSFERCLQAARAQAQKEIREAADSTPLSEIGKE